MGEEGANAVVEVAKGKPQLTTLCGFKPDQTEADLSDQSLKVGDAILLTFDLARNSTLVKLKYVAHLPPTCCQQPWTPSHSDAYNLLLFPWQFGE